jgi:hypothetical protein
MLDGLVEAIVVVFVARRNGAEDHVVAHVLGGLAADCG